jgi:membrane-bound metal-dependent hydrolase YbcI (DUF457 family)
MSPVGHSLIGLSFAAVALPSVRGRNRQIGLAIAFVAIANLPDWPIPNWGHDRYDISHSFFVNLMLIVLAVSLWRAIPLFKSTIPFRCMLLGAGAWLSHLVLDSFYNHGQGIAIFWPFSDGRINFPIPWFNTCLLYTSPSPRDRG